ncbi:hypothetical protein [Patulibacter minatonensis]|uniref:hypothetical protein n=1 Tax=Patulibacter minatonensis TaxID=298163 RepID=UPI0004790E25|nr:hypothetical protein [Patulibacter minatonensis]
MPIPSPTIAEGVDRRIRAAAAHAGLTIDELSAAATELHPDVIGLRSANIRGLGAARPARVEQLEAIANVTGMPLWYLVAGTDAFDQAHEPHAIDTIPSETLAEVQAMRAELRELSDRIAKKDA